jgi:tetratricopeptide (TPR) repeat protein
MNQPGTSNKFRNAFILVLSVTSLILIIKLTETPPQKGDTYLAVEEEKKDIDTVLRQKGKKGSYRLRFLVSQDDLWKRIKNMKMEIATPMVNEALDSFSAGTQLLSQGRHDQNKLNLGRAIHKLNFTAESIPTFETFYNLGYAYFEYGDYGQALVEFQKALDYEKDHPGLYTGIGMSLVRLGRIEEGLDQLHMGLSIADSLKDKAWKGEILGRLGIIYQEKKQTHIAQVYFQEAIIKNYETGYMEGVVDSLCAYSQLKMENKGKKVKSYLSTALEIAKEVGYQVGVAKAATTLASLSQSNGKNNVALDFYHQALAAYMDLENSLGQARTFNKMAQIHERQGNFDQAIQHYQESLLLHQQINHQEGKSYDLGNIGLLYYVKGDLDQALKYYQGALVVHEETGNQQKKSITLGNIGLIYFDKQMVKKALAYLQNALIIDRRIHFKEGEALHLAHIGNAYLMSKELEKARESFESSLTIYMALKNRTGEARQWRNMGQYYLSAKDNSKALKSHLAALAAFREVGDVEGEATQMSKIGMLYRETGEMDKSLKYLNNSLEIFENAHQQTHRKFAGLEPVDLSRQMLTHE